PVRPGRRRRGGVGHGALARRVGRGVRRRPGGSRPGPPQARGASRRAGGQGAVIGTTALGRRRLRRGAVLGLIAVGLAVLAAAGCAVATCRRAGRTEAGPYLLLAELYMERADWEQADRLCRSVLGQDPGHPRAHLDMEQIALAEDDAGAAIPHLLRAAESPAL